MRINKLILDLKYYTAENNLTAQDEYEAECRYLDVLNVRALGYEWLYDAPRDDMWILKRVTFYDVIVFLKKIRDIEIKISGTLN